MSGLLKAESKSADRLQVFQSAAGRTCLFYYIKKNRFFFASHLMVFPEVFCFAKPNINLTAQADEVRASLKQVLILILYSSNVY